MQRDARYNCGIMLQRALNRKEANKRGFRVRLGSFVALPIFALGVAHAGVASAGAATAKIVTLAGSRSPLPRGARVIGSVRPARALGVTVTLRPRDPAGLARFVAAVSTPGSASYHRYLTPAEFASRFGAPPQAIGLVDTYLAGEGLDPGPQAAGGLSLYLRLSAAQAERAFHTTLETVRLTSGRTALWNSGPVRLPLPVGVAVQAIIGLSNVAAARPVPAGNPSTARAVPAATGATTSAYATPSTLPAHASGATASAHSAPASTSAHATGAAYPPPACTAAQDLHGWAPGQLSQGYDLGPLYASGASGNGQTVGIVAMNSYSSSDISVYDQCYGISPTVTPVYVDGETGNDFGPDTAEATEDIENVSGILPRATIDVYDAPETGQGYYDAMAAAVDDDTAQVISISLSVCEQDLASGQAQSEETLFEQAAAQGQTVLAAAGDYGAEGCYNLGAGNPNYEALAVSDPASDPYVTGVGGTNLSSISPRKETVWNDTAQLGGAGGGGISTVWPMPLWQSAPGVVNKYSSKAPCKAASSYCREVPDVSANAQVGLPLYCTAGTCNGRGWQLVGGTSMSTPLVASVAVMANQLCGSGPAGFINPSLYEVATMDPGAYNDITSGNNYYAGPHTGLYPATAGYDLASGLGSPVGAGLVSELCNLESVKAAVPSLYVPLAPARICDTRAGNPSGLSGTELTQCEGRMLGPTSELTIQVAGLAGDGVPLQASGAVLNVTVVGASQPTYLSVYPAGTLRPVASGLNAPGVVPVAGLVYVALPASGAEAGAVTLYNNSGSADVVVDVEGYTAASSGGSPVAGTYVALASPQRITDTRCNDPSRRKQLGAECSQIPSQNSGIPSPSPGSVESVAIAGVTGIPSGAEAAVVNLTEAGPNAGAGYFTMYPSGASRPVASNVNWTTGEIRSNRVLVKLGSGGSADLYSSVATNAVIDVAGYIAGPSATKGGAQFDPVRPIRICDTRAGDLSQLSGTQAQCAGKTLAPLSKLSVKVDSVGGLPSSGVKAVIINVTAVGGTASGYLSVNPSSVPPLTSDVNWSPGTTVPNLVVASVATGGILTLYNGSGAGSVNAIVDVYAYLE